MKIAINGCGIAGPTLAYWLKKYGFEPVLFEKAPEFRSGGYIIDFWGLGYDIAGLMGLHERLHKLGYQLQRLSLVDEHGHERTGLDGSVFHDVTDGRYVSLPRGDLAQAIFNLCHDVEVHFGCSIQTVEQEDDKVWVGLTDGSRQAFDLVVGADGLHSKIRELTFGKQEEFEKDLGYYACAFRLPDYPHRTQLNYVSHTIPKRQMARFALRDGSTLFFLVFHKDLVQHFPESPEETKAALRRVFADMAWEAPEVLEQLEACDSLYFDRVSQIKLPHWSRERVALVGDAAACASLLAGEGSGLGMLEAYVLAGELAAAGGDHRVALAGYEDKLKPFLAAKQAAAIKNAAAFAPKSKLGIFFRDLATDLCAIPVVARLLIGSALKDDFELPQYGNLDGK